MSEEMLKKVQTILALYDDDAGAEGKGDGDAAGGDAEESTIATKKGDKKRQKRSTAAKPKETGDAEEEPEDDEEEPKVRRGRVVSHGRGCVSGARAVGKRRTSR